MWAGARAPIFRRLHILAQGCFMLHVFSAILLGISTNLDNFFLGFAFGMRGRRISLPVNLLIGLLSAIVTFGCSYLAYLCNGFGRWPNYIGGGLIVLIGVVTMIRRESGGEDQTARGVPLAFREAALLGVALAINCLPVAFGAGLTGVAPLAAALAVGAFSVLTVGAGNWMGRHTAVKVQKAWLSFAAGGVMVVLGALELFS